MDVALELAQDVKVPMLRSAAGSDQLMKQINQEKDEKLCCRE